MPPFREDEKENFAFTDFLRYLLSGSVSGIVTESVVALSIIISIIRYDILRQSERKEETANAG